MRAGVSATERERLFKENGINKLYGAIDPKFLGEHVDPTTYLPQDILHLFPDVCSALMKQYG